MFYNELLREKQRLEQMIDFVEKKLPELPDGQLNCAGTVENPKAYQYVNAAKHYIPKDNTPLIKNLAIKKYFTAQLSDFRRKLKGIRYYLKTNDPALDKAPKLLQKESRYCEFIAPLFRPKAQDLAAWAEEAYPKYTKYPGQLKHETVKGLKVRSKAEAMIAMQLWEHRIPFRYEEEISLGATVHPDFTLRHPTTGDTVYWEHFGRADDPNYRNNALQKLQRYSDYGIFPPDRLIVTWETTAHPLLLSEIQWHIQQFLSD